jgi:acetoin utilization deacetylase AcuC-like enzyme
MTGLIFHEQYIRHNPGWGHPESPDRLKVIKRAYDSYHLRDKTTLHSPKPALEKEIILVHDPAYYLEMGRMCKGGFYHPMMESELSEDTWEAALLAVGGGIEACNKVLAGEWHNAFCAVRPPGHHATPYHAMGFCMFNNIAIAAVHLLEKGVEKVLIVDWDVHHGNGTQETFYGNKQVFFYSTHQRNLYPYGSGEEEQIGIEEGEGFTLNRPLKAGTSGEEHLRIFLQDLEAITQNFQPEFALISAGFDSMAVDLLGKLNLEESHLRKMTEAVSRVAKGKVVSFLEGGYNLVLLEKGFLAHLDELVKLGE